MSRLGGNYQELSGNEVFIRRHIGPSQAEQTEMLELLGCSTLEELTDKVVPASIRRESPLEIGEPLTEFAALEKLRTIATRNKPAKSLIGMGYYGCHTPNVILRNIMENPAWYTAYTPYQAEISQGRLEAMLNFQTMVTDLTGMEVANASLLDEATAAAEAMAFCSRLSKNKGDTFFASDDCHPQTLAVLKTRAKPLGINVVIGNPADGLPEDACGVLIQYPGSSGVVQDPSDIIAAAQAQKSMVVVASDLLALVSLKSPGSLGADVVVGSSQRFGVPLGFGGPHAAFFASRETMKRSIPGRIIGVSIDANGDPAYRMSLQTREQHIRREKATSNICTAQALLAVMASMYAVYHGPKRLKQIAERTHRLTRVLAEGLVRLGYEIEHGQYFDTIKVRTGDWTASVIEACRVEEINLRIYDQHVGISLDETCTRELVERIWALSAFDSLVQLNFEEVDGAVEDAIPDTLRRDDEILTHPIFNSHHSETEMLRYMRKLADKDLALDRAMIPLGSCTMKLNATAEMIPVTWPEIGNIHPYAPKDQIDGYLELTAGLERMLCDATGYSAVSLQPNAGSQGEFAGLLAIAAYHESRGEGHRNICLIPSSAHGTNPASAVMAGMKVVVTACDDQGNVDVADMRAKAEEHSDNLAALMITYPSTHGVFEEAVTEICDIIHEHGGQVYLDGANLNAMVGLCAPGKFGSDVSHLNLHKTFCIPHGGGGPGVGPIGVAAHLAPFLPSDPLEALEDGQVGAVSATYFGSASILPISWMYIAMMGSEGLTRATQCAILNANYIAARLAAHYPVLYTGSKGMVAHECILDLRQIKDDTGVSVDDVAKRLIDFGFHAPTMSFPVAGTLMIEPTESESKYELDRFCDAMIAIREEVRDIENGKIAAEDSALAHAPHTVKTIADDDWDRKYSRKQAAFPTPSLLTDKYWSPVGRVDNVYGDKNLVCTCPPIEAYQDAAD